MKWRWQNLKEDSPRDLVHGRGWLDWGKFRDAYPDRKSLRIEWRLGPWSTIRLLVTVGGEDDYQLGIGLGFADLWLTLSGVRDYRALYRGGYGLDTGFYYGDDHLVLKWACDGMSWPPERGWSKSWFVRDVLLGRAVYTEGGGEPVPATVTMPEGAYLCTVIIRTDTWKRPRWPKPLRVTRAITDCPGGIPFPGKGENSWDCGEDACYGQTAPATTVEEAITKLQAYVTGRRLKYGGRDWKPERAA